MLKEPRRGRLSMPVGFKNSTAGDLQVAVEAIESAQLVLPVRRPAYSVLDTRRSVELGLEPLRSWREALADCVEPSEEL